MMAKKVPEMIKKIMEKKSWTQVEVALHFGVHKSQITRWLNGAQPRYDVMVKIIDEYSEICA